MEHPKIYNTVSFGDSCQGNVYSARNRVSKPQIVLNFFAHPATNALPRLRAETMQFYHAHRICIPMPYVIEVIA